MKCRECGRPMRRVGSPKVPGMVTANGSRCHACCRKEQRAAARVGGEPADVRVLCARCGIETMWRRGNVCRDCLSVLTKEEVAAWAA